MTDTTSLSPQLVARLANASQVVSSPFPTPDITTNALSFARQQLASPRITPRAPQFTAGSPLAFAQPAPYAADPNRFNVPGTTLPADTLEQLLENEALLSDKQITQNPLLAGLPARGRVSQLPAQRLLGGLSPSATPFDPNYQTNATTLLNKVEEMGDWYAQLPRGVREQLLEADVDRITGGSSPLTRRQTVLAAQTLVTGEQATPEEERGEGGFLNLIKDIGTGAITNVRDVATGIIRLPEMVGRDIVDLPNAGERFSTALEEGQSPLKAAFESTPGLRLLPGSYIAANIENPRELLTNPIFTALDASPFVRGAAGATAVGKAAKARALTSLENIGPLTPRIKYRPARSLLTERLTPDGTLELRPRIRDFRDRARTTKLVEQYRSAFSAESRGVSTLLGRYGQRIEALIRGNLDANPGTVDALAKSTADFLDKWKDKYPALSTKETPFTRKGRAAREAEARFIVDDLTLNSGRNLDPGFVNDYRDLTIAYRKRALADANAIEFDNEFYSLKVGRELQARERVAMHTQLMYDLGEHYLAPSEITLADLRSWNKRMREAKGKRRTQIKGALEQVYDAYELETSHVEQLLDDLNRTARGNDALADRIATTTTFTSSRTPANELAQYFNSVGDRQALIVELGSKWGKRSNVTQALRNLGRRRNQPPGFTAKLANDARSLAGRIEFHNNVGRRFTSARAEQRWNALRNLEARRVPARFERMTRHKAAEKSIEAAKVEFETQYKRPMNASEVDRLHSVITSGAWDRAPGLDGDWLRETSRRIANEETRSWMKLRAEGHDPLYVHHVSPRRSKSTIRPVVGVVPNDLSQLLDRANDFSPTVDDLSVALTHQAVEYLQHEYSLRAFEEIWREMAVPLRDLRNQYLPLAESLARRYPNYDVNGHLSRLIDRNYAKFDPIEHGFSWGSERMSRFGDDYRIPRAVASNIERLKKQVHIGSTVLDIPTKMFRYNVIGLSPSVTINNFVGNQMAAMMEVGPRYIKNLPKARRLYRLSESGDNANAALRELSDEVRAAMAAEQPHLEHLTKDQWMASPVGAKMQQGINAHHTFLDNAFVEGLRRFGGNLKSAVDYVVKKNLDAQRFGDQVTRAAIYLNEIDRWGKHQKRGRGELKNLTRAQAESAATEMVNRVIVDYASFTPIERGAIRTYVPFYSFIGHAVRFSLRYPIDHPIRVAIAAAAARVQKEHLGALPGSFMSMIPLGSLGPDGHQRFLSARMFTPFADTADMFTLAGWVSALNPTFQAMLQQFGVIRGQQDLYPTARYNPETGRMEAVNPSLFESMIFSTIPRFGAVASMLGLNPTFNEIRERDPDASLRSLITQAGVPRMYRDIDVYEEITRAELNRQQSERDVLNEAMRSGDYSELLRYPSLRAYYDVLRSIPPDQIDAMTARDPDALLSMLAQATSGGTNLGFGGVSGGGVFPAINPLLLS